MLFYHSIVSMLLMTNHLAVCVMLFMHFFYVRLPSQIVQWMDEVGRASKIATVYSIGKTYQGRETIAIKVREKTAYNCVCLCLYV